VSAAQAYVRHFMLTRELPHSQLARFTQIDYDREMALVAIHQGEVTAEVRTVCDPDNLQAELSVLVRPDWSHTELATVLLARVMTRCTQRGISKIMADVMEQDHPVLDAMARLGFRRLSMAGPVARMELRLAEPGDFARSSVSAG